MATRFKIFVAHRVQQIQDCTDVNAWNYVPTDKNPADLASRGINPDDASKLKFWLEGPQFLKEESQYTRLFEEPASQEKELKTRQCCAMETAVDLQTFIMRYSSLYRLQRAACWLVKLFVYVHGKPTTKEITVEYMERVLNQLLRFEQRQQFPGEWKALEAGKHVATSSKLNHLTPQGKDGLICFGGRLANASDDVNKHPIILGQMSPHNIS